MSESITCQAVDTRRDRIDFLNLEKTLYRDDPNWVPPLWGERKALVGFKSHPFYLDAEARAFVARRGGETVGRIVAIVNHAHNRTHEEKRGFFGFFESVDDLSVARSLMDAAKGWLADQGMDSIRGPLHPSMNYECGLLVDGFNSPPTFMISYNHPYYGGLLEQCGLEKSQDLFSYVAGIAMLDHLDPKLKFIIDASAERFRVKCRPLSTKHFDRDVRTFLDIYNQSLTKTWGYVPLSEAEIRHQSKQLKHLLVPELISIAEIDGKPVGAGFGLLDFNPIIRKIDGRLFPTGWWHLLREKKRLTRLRLISTNVIPEYQRWGLGVVVLSRVVPGAVAFGIEEAEFSWVLESNSLSRGTIERGGATQSKVHRLYDGDLAS